MTETRGELHGLLAKLTEKQRWLFSLDCAERVLPIYESVFPDDKRPHRAIAHARDYVRGRVTKEVYKAALLEAYHSTHEAVPWTGGESSDTDYERRDKAYWAAEAIALAAASEDGAIGAASEVTEQCVNLVTDKDQEENWQLSRARSYASRADPSGGDEHLT